MINSFLYLLVFWIPAYIILFYGPKFHFTRIAGLILFVIGFTPLAEILEKFALPNLNGNVIWFHYTLVLIGCFYTLSYYFYPYLLLLFSMVYSQIIKESIFVYLLFFIPIIFTYIFFPFNLKNLSPLPISILPFKTLNLWVISYILLANFILLYTVISETNPIRKKQSLANFVTTLSPTFVSLFIGYLYPELNRNELCRIIQIAAFIIPYFFFLNRYGIFGVKMFFEKDLYEQNLQAISYGASYINHTVKNEANKIKACVTLLEKRLPESDKGQEYLHTISLSLNQILSFTDLIQKKTQILILQLQPVNIQSVVIEVLQGFAGIFEKKNIKVSQNYSYNGNIYTDRMYIRELISNIITNATEALPDGGLLNIESYKQKKYIILEIKDTGIGIPREDLAKVIEPFYSTKECKSNLGLGLTYCYNVMQKHGGELDIQSTLGKGTTVYLKFPEKIFKTASN